MPPGCSLPCPGRRRLPPRALWNGAWYVSTGQARSFSEQQIVDCGWGYVNGCNGGDFEPGMGHALSRASARLQRQQRHAAVVALASTQHTGVMGHHRAYARAGVGALHAAAQARTTLQGR